MKKTTSISIRVSEKELNIFKRAALLESYASYSEFIRRTALKEAQHVIEEHNLRGGISGDESELN